MLGESVQGNVRSVSRRSDGDVDDEFEPDKRRGDCVGQAHKAGSNLG